MPQGRDKLHGFHRVRHAEEDRLHSAAWAGGGRHDDGADGQGAREQHSAQKLGGGLSEEEPW